MASPARADGERGTAMALRRSTAMSRARYVAAAVAAMLLTIALAAPTAGAEVRNGAHSNRFPEELPGSPTQPVLAAASMRYDTTAGSLQVVLRFGAPLADPAQT